MDDNNNNNNNSNNSNSGDEQTITIVIILIAAIVIFFLVIAWCGFFYGLWRNRKVALDISRIEQHRQQQQYRRQQLLKQCQQQQHNAPQQRLQQQRYSPQQQQQLQQQLQQQFRQQFRQQQQHNANRSRPSSQLSSDASHTDFMHQPQLNSYPQTPYHGERVSVHSRYITPPAVAMPVFIPPRDYDDDDQTPLHAATNSSVSSSGLDHSYHNRTFDYFEGSGSPKQSFTNIGYQSTISYPADSTVGLNQSNLRSAYSPAPPRSTSTPFVPKMQAKYKRTSQPASFENYSMEMQQYQQLQYWPQNY